MSHKADASFFDEKRPWSKRKDQILGEYITAYLPKIATQRHPILIVDGFAGPGKFDDGQPGSPFILAKVIQKAIPKLSVRTKLLCIDHDKKLFEKLSQNLQGFDFVELNFGRFSQSIKTIGEAAKTHSVFLYVDPFTVEGLIWKELDSIFEHLRLSNMSVEVLLNFNAASFARRGLAALRLAIPVLNPDEEGNEEVDAPFENTVPSIARLDNVLGTSDWQSVLQSDSPFCDKVAQINEILLGQLRKRFQEVCFHPMLAMPHHTVPKYFLVFASRHPDGLALMNDAMVKSLQTLAGMAKQKEETLFEMRSEELVPDKNKIVDLALELTASPIQRGELITSIIRKEFGKYARKDIRGTIEKLLGKQLKSETGKTRINDSVKVWRV